jgi:hypothetical protein
MYYSSLVLDLDTHSWQILHMYHANFGGMERVKLVKHAHSSTVISPDPANIIRKEIANLDCDARTSI